jgi:hypothetical protein
VDDDDVVDDDPPREIRAFDEIVEPKGGQGTWRDLPRLLLASVRLAWEGGRRELLLTSTLQVAASVGVAAQLFAGKAVFAAILGAHGGSFGDVVPALAVLVAVTVALDLAQAGDVAGDADRERPARRRRRRGRSGRNRGGARRPAAAPRAARPARVRPALDRVVAKQS